MYLCIYIIYIYIRLHSKETHQQAEDKLNYSFMPLEENLFVEHILQG